MADVEWVGGISTDANVAGNWDGAAIPTNNDIVIFSSNATKNCDLSNLGDDEFQRIEIKSDFGYKVIFDSQNITLNLGAALKIYKAGTISVTATSSIIFTGTPDIRSYRTDGTYTNSPYYGILIDSSGDSTLNTATYGAFDSAASWANMTFNFQFGTTVLFSLMDGVYPNITFSPTATVNFDTIISYDTYSVSAIPTVSNANSYRAVKMRNFDASSSNVVVNPSRRTFDDANKVFRIEGVISGVGANEFDWGYTTLELSPSANTTLPTTGNTSYGSSSALFNARYHKLVIDESSGTSYYYLVASNCRLVCNELIINGRLYGNADHSSTSTAEIQTVKRPIVNGDWNFEQVADGIYRVRGTDELLPTAYGGTGVRSASNGALLIGNGRGFTAANLTAGSGITVTNSAGAISLKPMHPIFFERHSIGTNTGYAFRAPTATSSTAFPAAFPLPFAGKVVAVALVFTGGLSTEGSDTIRIQKNGGTATKDFSYNASTDLTNTHSTTYTYTATGSDVDFSFNAGDVIQIRRQSGVTTYTHGQAIIWVQFD